MSSEFAIADGADRTPAEHAEVRRRIYLREGGYCTYCGRVLVLDEVVLDCDGGRAAWHQVAEADLLCACQDCHQDKGPRTRAQYRAHRRMLHAHEMLRSLKPADAGTA